MAQNFKNSIQLGIKLQKSSDVKKELDSLIKELGKSKINLDITLKDKNILGTLEKLSAELKEINKASFSNVDKNLKNVGKALGETENKARALNSTLGGGFSSASMSTATKELDNVVQKLEEVNKATKTSVAEIGSNIKKTGDSISGVGDTLTSKVTTPLALISGVATKIGMDFESQMSRVKAISGSTGEEFTKLHDQALQLGADTAFSAKQAAEGMENLASAGFNTNEIIEAMPGLLDLAASSGESLANSSDIAASTLRGFGLEAYETGRVADVLAKNAASTNAAVADTGEAMKYIAPVAKAMGLSLEEVTAAIGLMANAGIKGSQSGTTLRSTLTRLASPSKEAAGMMEELGFKAFDSQGKILPLSGILDNLSKSLKGKTDQQKQDAIATIFGQEAMSGMLSLVDAGSSQLIELTDAYKSADGAAKEMAKTMQDNAKSSIEQMVGSLETAAIKLQEVAAPSIINIANEVQDLANNFADLPQPVQESVIKFALLSATIGPVTKVVGTLTSGIGSLVTLGGRLASTFELIGEGASIGGTALTAFSTAGMVATGVASALIVGVAGAVTYQGLLNKSVSTSTDELNAWEKVVNSCTGSVVKSKSELVKAGLIYRDFGEGVSDSFKEGIETATKEYHDFEMTLTGENSGEKISEEGKKKISSAIDSMIDGAKSTINKRKSEIQTELSKMFNQEGGIDSSEQAVLDEASKASDEKLKQIEDIQKSISDVWTKAIQEHGKLSQEDVETIENYLQQVKQIQAEVEAKNTAESDFTKNQFGERLKGISAEDASKAYQEASQELTKNFADARARYKTGMDDLANLEKQAEDAGETARAESFKKQIEDKKKEYDELINTEKTKRREYLDMLYEKNSQLNGKLNEVDGTMFSTKDFNAQKDLNKLKQQFTEIANVTESGMIRVKDANGKWNDILVQVDSATGNITSAYNTMTGEFGAYSEKFATDAESSGKRVKESLENLEKSLTTLGGGVKLDLNNNAINASTDELIGKLQTVIEKADGTKVAIQDINGTQVKLEFDKDGTLTNLTDVQDAIAGKVTDNPAVVNIDVNDEEALAKFTETENKINNIDGQTPTVTPNAQTSNADTNLDTTQEKVDKLDGSSAEATVSIDTGNTLSLLDRIKSGLSWLSGKVFGATVQISQQGMDYGEQDGSRFTAGHNAKGTDNWRGGLTWINEEGGELVNLPDGTQIIPHDLSEKIIEEESKNNGSGNLTVNQIDIYQGKDNETGTYSVNTSNTLDSPYIPETDTSKMSDVEKKAYEAKKKAQEEEEKALKDKADKEKQYLGDIGGYWESNSKSVSQSIKNIELQEDELGENATVSQKIDFLNQKYQLQLSLLSDAEKQLNTYKNTTLTTSEGQEELSEKIQDATDTLIEQKKVVVDAYNEMQSSAKDAIEELIEKQKELAETTLEEKQRIEKANLETDKTDAETNHNNIMAQYEEELQALEDKREAEEEENKEAELKADILEKQTSLTEKQIELEKLKNQKTIQSYEQDENGNWNFVYTYDKSAVEDKQDEVDDAQSNLDDSKTNLSDYYDDLEYENNIKEIEDKKEAEDAKYEIVKANLEKQSELLEEQHEKEKKQLDLMYKDTTKLVSDYLAQLNQQYGEDWTTISETISKNLDELTAKYNNILNIDAYGTTEEYDSALGLESAKQSSVEDTTSSSKTGSTSSKSALKTQLEQFKESNKQILEALVENNKKMLVEKNDYTTKALQVDTNYSDKTIKLQKESEATQLLNSVQFLQTQNVLTESMMTVLHLIYDEAWGDIVSVGVLSTEQMLKQLQVMSEAYEKFREMYNEMNEDDKKSAISISNVLSDFQTTKAGLPNYVEAKELLYNLGSNSLTYSGLLNPDILSSTNSIDLSTLNNAISNLTTTTTNATTTTNNFNFSGMTVQSSNATDWFDEMLTIAENKTKLKY